MDEIKNLNFGELWKCWVQVNERVVSNYLKNFSGYHHDLRDMSLTYMGLVTKMMVNPEDMLKIYISILDFLKLQQSIFGKTILGSKKNNNPVIEPDADDKRFSDPEWDENPFLNFLKQNYLLLEKLVQEIIDGVEVDEKMRRKLDFYAGHYLDAFSPTNFLFTNPEAIRLAMQTDGKSVLDGINNLIADLEKGKISQTDESAFEVGLNIANTPGAVVYEDELMQLIQYTPTTKNVFEIPLVIVPSWINKYYILDLGPKKSFVKFLVDQGITVFMVSWHNPKPGMGYLTFDDYVGKGAINAIRVAQNISGSDKVNTLGYCLGGTLLSVAASILSTNDPKNNPVNSITFLASMVDFSHIGPMGDVVNDALIRKLERGELLHDGIMDGADMETAFNLLQANNLIWKYVINNYLEGKKPAAFDILYWTNDNTNLPGDMYKYYMRNMVFENKLSRKNALTICNTRIDIGKIDVPVLVIGFMQDIISPAETAFTTTELVRGPVEFILGGSGHVVGAVNPPTKNKYGYYLNGKLDSGFEEWKRTAKYFDGSWWTPWAKKLITLSGNEVNAPSCSGNKNYSPIEPAPGCYVKEKCGLKSGKFKRGTHFHDIHISNELDKQIKELLK